MLDQNLSFSPPKNTCGQNDRDYNCYRYTHLKVLDTMLTFGLNLIELNVSTFLES